MTGKRKPILWSGFFLALLAFAWPQAGPPEGERSLTIQSKPFAAFEPGQPAREHFGELTFRGGLVLTSPDKTLGGISALCVLEDGEHFIACSDRSWWVRGRIVYREGRPEGIAEAALSPLLDADGQPARQWDAESLARDGGTLYVGLERIHTIMRFDYDEKGVLARGQPVPAPPELKDLPKNQSLEGLVFVPAKDRLGGTLIAFSERGFTESGDLKAFLIGGPTPGPFAVKRTAGFDISDAAMLPEGDILVLERLFSPERGVAVRIRRLPLSEIKPGALVDGPTVIEADMRFQIDNMEALSVHRTPWGETRLTLMSDDNFSPLQRTLLLQFALPEK